MLSIVATARPRGFFIEKKNSMLHSPFLPAGRLNASFSIPSMLATTNPFSFILFGASGNLAKLKIYPALYTLSLKKRLPENYNIVGYARTAMTCDEFRALVAESIKKDMIEVNPKTLHEFLSHVQYQTGKYDAEADFKALGTLLDTLEQGWTKHIRLAYLSIPPEVIYSILKNLCAADIDKHDGQFRCILEKPVGSDLESFRKIKKQLTECLKPDEIYLLDHYLGKEAVRNIYYLRLANPIFEHLLTNALVQHVEITASEPMGIEGRAGYFEHTGMLRDWFQSHLLMMMSALTMSLKDSDNELLGSRHEALSQIKLPGNNMEDLVLQGQYTAGTLGSKSMIGYKDEEGVAPDSRVHTFAAMKLQTEDQLWKGVPFYLRAGKRMTKKETRISLQFKELRKNTGKNMTPNRLDIILIGEAGMRIVLQTKVGGTEPMFRPLILEDPLVCVGDCLPEHGLLLLEAIHGKKDWFLTFEEVELAWKLIDPVQKYLDDAKTPLYTYAAGSDGPAEAKEWIEHDGIDWF